MQSLIAQPTVLCCYFLSVMALCAVPQSIWAQEDAAVQMLDEEPAFYAPDAYETTPMARPTRKHLLHQPPRCCCPSQVWVNALFLSRDSASGQSIVYDGPKGNEILSTDDLNSGTAWGPSVGVTFCPNRCNPCNRIGFEFYAVDGWSADSQVAGNNSVQFPSFPYLPELQTPGDPTTGYGVANFHYHSSLYNTEFNIYHDSSRVNWLTWLVGFRWIEISEEFGSVFETGGTTPNYAIDTNNHLYGAQLGAAAHLDTYGPWRLESWLKLGLYANVADQDTTEDFTSAGGQLIGNSASSNGGAFSTDMGLTVSRQLTERLGFRFSYMLLWIEGIALAPEQLDNSDPSSGIASVDRAGGTFYHGGFIGINYLW